MLRPKASIPLLLGILLAGGAVYGLPLFTDKQEENPPLQGDRPIEREGSEALFYSRSVNSTDILFNITNDSSSNQTVSLVLSRDEKLPGFFDVNAELYHNTGEYSRFFLGQWTGYTGVPGRGPAAVKAGPVEFEVPVRPIPTDENYEASGTVDIGPGSHHLFVAVNDVEMDLLIESEGLEGSVTIQTVEENPKMEQRLWANVVGHWDEVHTEVWGTRVGYINASTTVLLENSYRSVELIGLGDYMEASVVDEEGGGCKMSRTFREPGWLLYYPPKGTLQLHGENLAVLGGPFLIAHILDIPIEWEPRRELCGNEWESEAENSPRNPLRIGWSWSG